MILLSDLWEKGWGHLRKESALLQVPPPNPGNIAPHGPEPSLLGTPLLAGSSQLSSNTSA